MNDKITLQAISDIFASHYGVSKKTSDVFGKAFFDTIVEGLNKDGIVRIEGLGTFKIVEVGSRESVNVTNGERIVIDGYKKVTFVADDVAEPQKEEVKEPVAEVAAPEPVVEGPKAEEVIAPVAAPIIEEVKQEEVIAPVVAPTIEEVKQEEVIAPVIEEPKQEEVTVDEFSGIDLIISTPESLAAYNNRIPSAITEPVKVVEEPTPIVEEPAPVIEETPSVVEESTTPIAEEQEHVVPEPAVSPEPIVEPEPVVVPKPVAEPIISNVTPEQKVEDELEEESDAKRWLLVAFAAVLLICVFVCGYKYVNTEEVDSQPEPPVEKIDNKQAIADSLRADSIAKALVEDSIKQEKLRMEEEAKIAAEKAAAERAAAEKADAERAAKAVAEAKKAAEKAAAAKLAAEKAAAAKKEAERKAAAEKAAAAKKEAERKAAAAKPKVPRTHVLRQGEHIYQLSRKYYGTPDSAKAIIRLNKFANPNNVPLGTVVKLP